MLFRLSVSWFAIVILTYIFLATPVLCYGKNFGRTALLIIDVQDCFLPGGSLAVNSGEEVIPIITNIRNQYRDSWDLVVWTKDWHCADHVSFVDSHSDGQLYQEVTLRYTEDGTLCLGGTITAEKFPGAVNCSDDSSGRNLSQVLWPTHCVMDVSTGAASSRIDSNLKDSLMGDNDLIVTKGSNCEVDSYSGFYDNGRFGETPLRESLEASHIDTIFVTGLALDYCVKFTALDGKSLGYNVYVILDATRGVNGATSQQALREFNRQGIEVVASTQLEAIFKNKLPVGDTGSRHLMSQLCYILVAASMMMKASLEF